MKTHHTCALALLLLPLMVSAAEQAAPAREAIARPDNRPAIEINDLIERVAKRTGKQFLVDPRVRAEVALTGLDVDRVDYVRLLAILNVHGFVAYQSADLVKVLPDAAARQLPIPLVNGIAANTLDDEMVTLTVQAKNMCSALAVPVLRPLMPQYAHLAAMPQTNTLLIVDRAANARKIVEMIERLDKAAPPGQRCPDGSSSFSK
jgi:general secretion pathway protein D